MTKKRKLPESLIEIKNIYEEFLFNVEREDKKANILAMACFHFKNGVQIPENIMNSALVHLLKKTNMIKN